MYACLRATDLFANACIFILILSVCSVYCVSFDLFTYLCKQLDAMAACVPQMRRNFGKARLNLDE